MGAAGSVSKSRYHLTTEDIIKESGPDINLAQKYILVTGATNGLGLETSRALACAGAKVYLMGRDEAKLQGVMTNINNELQQKRPTGSVQSVVCDLNSLASIKQFAQKFTREKQPLNLLILNAGLMNFNHDKTVDGLEQMIGVNHIGHAYLTQLLMPILIANAPSRVVILSSDLQSGPPLNYEMLDRWNSNAKDAKKGWSMLNGYQQSKLANVLFARALTSRYNDKQITAYSVHPGVINTNLGAAIPLAGFMKLFIKKKTVSEGAATTVYCALKPDLENETGRYFADSTVTNIADKWTNEDLNTFWDWTEKVIQERTANL
jgi:NAD(P)-dependent dehydrogenase (short-subunit alcohol dehydrogenase family)